MYRILGLPIEINIARHSIAFIAGHVTVPPDYDEVFEERTYQYGKLGLKALKSHYGNQEGVWDPLNSSRTANELRESIPKLRFKNGMSCRKAERAALESACEQTGWNTK